MTYYVINVYLKTTLYENNFARNKLGKDIFLQMATMTVVEHIKYV